MLAVAAAARRQSRSRIDRRRHHRPDALRDRRNRRCRQYTGKRAGGVGPGRRPAHEADAQARCDRCLRHARRGAGGRTASRQSTGARQELHRTDPGLRRQLRSGGLRARNPRSAAPARRSPGRPPVAAGPRRRGRDRRLPAAADGQPLRAGVQASWRGLGPASARALCKLPDAGRRPVHLLARDPPPARLSGLRPRRPAGLFRPAS